MKTPRAFLLLLIVAMAVSLSCGDDSTTPKTPVPSGFKDLSKKGHVLNNFELAHNKRDSIHYDAVIDDNFTLYYTEGDVGGGGTEVQWGRTTDLPATHALFTSVDKLDFTLDDSNITWIEAPAPGGLENWFSTTVYYHFNVQMGNTTYIPNAGAKMQLSVRNTGTEAMPQWKLVELRDLGGPSLASASSVAATRAKTYGSVKALFRE